MNFREEINFTVNNATGDVVLHKTGDDLERVSKNLTKNISRSRKRRLLDNYLNKSNFEYLGNYINYINECNDEKIKELTNRYMYDFDVEAFQLLSDSNDIDDPILLNCLLFNRSIEDVINCIIDYIFNTITSKIDEYNKYCSDINSYYYNISPRLMNHADCFYKFNDKELSYVNYIRDLKIELDLLRNYLIKIYTESYRK